VLALKNIYIDNGVFKYCIDPTLGGFRSSVRELTPDESRELTRALDNLARAANHSPAIKLEELFFQEESYEKANRTEAPDRIQAHVYPRSGN
jgi:hypothetical protein